MATDDAQPGKRPVAWLKKVLAKLVAAGLFLLGAGLVGWATLVVSSYIVL